LKDHLVKLFSGLGEQEGLFEAIICWFWWVCPYGPVIGWRGRTV